MLESWDFDQDIFLNIWSCTMEMYQEGQYLSRCSGVLIYRKVDFSSWRVFFVQYGVKISLITSFKDTCFIEITPDEQKSTRGLYLCLWSSVNLVKTSLWLIDHRFCHCWLWEIQLQGKTIIEIESVEWSFTLPSRNRNRFVAVSCSQEQPCAT
jgi:hypothetical protein